MSTKCGLRKTSFSAALGLCLLATLLPARWAHSRGSDPCTAPGLDFPAFAFWRAYLGKEQIHVADAKAKCIRPVTLPTHAYFLQFSFPVGGTTDRGRLAWLEASAGVAYIVGVDFTVNPVTRNLTVYPKKTLYTGTAGPISLSVDGLSLYTTRHPVVGEVVIDRQPLDVTGSPFGPAVTVFQAVPGDSIMGISVNGPESVIYADYREYPSAMSMPQLVWIPLDGSNTINVIDSNSVLMDLAPAAHPTLDMVAYDLDIPVAQIGTTGCDPLVIKDIGGATVNYPFAPRFGIKSTWMNGKLLAEGRTKPSKVKSCGYTGTIMQLDPATGVQTPLTSGHDPDGR